MTPLENGVEILPAMLAVIAEVKETITFETYIFHTGQVADEFTNALAAKAQEGLKVHVLLDGMAASACKASHCKQIGVATVALLRSQV